MSNTTPLLPNSMQPALAVSSESVDKGPNAFSDGEATSIAINGGVTMKKYKSADDLESGLAPGWFSQ